jgi:hypothetical protein
VREEDGSLAGPIRRELLSHRRPPTDLRFGPQQPAVCQRLDLLFSHFGRFPDGAWIWDGRLLHLSLLKAGALGSKGHE